MKMGMLFGAATRFKFFTIKISDQIILALIAFMPLLRELPICKKKIVENVHLTGVM